MEANKILQADLLDIIFESRNKSYGAYELRRTYENRLKKSLLSVGGLLLLFLLGTLLIRKEGRLNNSIQVGGDIFLNKIDENIKPVPPRVIAPPRTPLQNQVKYAKPVVVNNSMTDEDDRIEEITGDQVIGTQTISSGSTFQAIQAPYVEPHSGVNEIPAKKNDEPSIYTVVQIGAEFPGGITQWQKYLEKHLDSEIAINNGAPEGVYTVLVRFVVSVDGSISDVVAETSLGYGLETEAVKIIRNGPKWIPAMQNGRQVKAYRRQPITFVVNAQ